MPRAMQLPIGNGTAGHGTAHMWADTIQCKETLPQPYNGHRFFMDLYLAYLLILPLLYSSDTDKGIRALFAKRV